MTHFFLRFLLLALLVSPLYGAELHLYAGAGLRKPVEVVVSRFEQETGNRVLVEYGGSGQILARYRLTGKGDLFLAGSAAYINELRGNAIASFSVARHIPVVAVRKDRAEGIHSLQDLAASSLTLGMGDASAIALGKSGEQLLDASGTGDALRSRVVVRTATIKQLVIYLLNGDVDAAILGRSDALKHRDRLVILPSPSGGPEEVATLTLLSSSADPRLARQLAERFVSPQGRQAFLDAGFLAPAQ